MCHNVRGHVRGQWRRQEAEVGGAKLRECGEKNSPAESRGVALVPVGVWGKVPETEKHDINFALRNMLVNAYPPIIPHISPRL